MFKITYPLWWVVRTDDVINVSISTNRSNLLKLVSTDLPHSVSVAIDNSNTIISIYAPKNAIIFPFRTVEYIDYSYGENKKTITSETVSFNEYEDKILDSHSHLTKCSSQTFGYKDFNQIEDYNEIILTYDKDGDLNSPTRSYANVKDNILVYGVVREDRIDLWPQNPGSSREIDGYPNPISLEAIH